MTALRLEGWPQQRCTCSNTNRERRHLRRRPRPLHHRRGDLLRQHDGGDVGVAARRGRHDRGVDHAQPRYAAHAAGGIDHGVAIVGLAHAAGANRVEGAGDVLADMLGERLVVPDQRGKIDAAIGECREHRTGERGDEVDQRGDERALDLVRRIDAVEAAQLVGEFHREGDARYGAHLLVPQHLDRAPKALHEAREIEVVASEVELHARRRVGPLQRNAAARHRLE